MVDGSPWHLVCYYKKQDVEIRLLKRPIEFPELLGLERSLEVDNSKASEEEESFTGLTMDSEPGFHYAHTNVGLRDEPCQFGDQQVVRAKAPSLTHDRSLPKDDLPDFNLLKDEPGFNLPKEDNLPDFSVPTDAFPDFSLPEHLLPDLDPFASVLPGCGSSFSCFSESDDMASLWPGHDDLNNFCWDFDVNELKEEPMEMMQDWMAVSCSPTTCAMPPPPSNADAY